MPEVYNWQLGRKMLYPYEERHPKWQFAFVFNINRCLACQTCSMADKSTWLFSKGQEYMWWNNVEYEYFFGDYLDDGYLPRAPQELKELPPIENTLATASSLTDHLMWQL